MLQAVLDEIYSTIDEEIGFKIIGYKRGLCKPKMNVKLTTKNGIICVILNAADRLLFASERDACELLITPFCVYLQQFKNQKRLPKTTKKLREYLGAFFGYENYNNSLLKSYETVRENKQKAVNNEIEKEIKNLL